MSGARGRGGDALWWAALGQVEGLGAASMLRLARAFGSPEAALHAPPEDLVGRGGVSAEQAEGVGLMRGSLALLEVRMAAWERAGIRLVAMGEPGYPAELLDLRTPPPLLYVGGGPLPEGGRAVAVVGTREPTGEGEMEARELARGFAERGFVNVSGLARGIDTAWHRGSLDAGGGETTAVLGCGLFRIYPPENEGLAEEIARRGSLVAEAPPEQEASRALLLARDRIQAALARAVIVVQAHRQCGSMVTASHAISVGRMLLGVPWSEGPFSEGWEKLRRMGARPIRSGDDLDRIGEEILAHRPGPRQERLL